MQRPGSAQTEAAPLAAIPLVVVFDQEHHEYGRRRGVTLVTVVPAGKRGKAIAVAAGVVLLAGVGVGLAVGLRGPSPTAAATVFTAQQQRRLEKGITAPTVMSQAGIVAVEVRHAFETRGKPLLPAGSHVTIRQATFRELSAQLATVNAVVSGPAPGRWQLVLVREAGRWLLAGTRKLA